MDYMEIARVEAKVPGVIAIDSTAKGLVYFFDDDKSRMVIAGEKGQTKLTMVQVKALLSELPEILEQKNFFTSREIYRCSANSERGGDHLER